MEDRPPIRHTILMTRQAILSASFTHEPPHFRPLGFFFHITAPSSRRQMRRASTSTVTYRSCNLEKRSAAKIFGARGCMRVWKIERATSRRVAIFSFPLLTFSSSPSYADTKAGTSPRGRKIGLGGEYHDEKWRARALLLRYARSRARMARDVFSGELRLRKRERAFVQRMDRWLQCGVFLRNCARRCLLAAGMINCDQECGYW